MARQPEVASNIQTAMTHYGCHIEGVDLARGDRMLA